MARPAFPKTLREFQAQFADEEACRAYLAQSRWPEGYRLPELGIRPTLHPASQPEALDGSAAELAREIVRRAEELERAWEREEVEEQERVRVPRVHTGGGRRWRKT